MSPRTHAEQLAALAITSNAEFTLVVSPHSITAKFKIRKKRAEIVQSYDGRLDSVLAELRKRLAWVHNLHIPEDQNV
jgi:hypothetical protein